MKNWFLKSILAGACLMIAPGSGAVEYNREIRPILAENCFACHGADSAARKAELRLDSFEEATKAREGGKGVVVPGKPEESELIRRITTKDEDDVMPPRKTKKLLSEAQIELLRKWVAEGAQYEAHWSFMPPKRPEVPKVKNSGWVKNEIDAFVLARLEKEGLTPAKEADRRTLARRLSLDLIGLPPTPEEVEEFVNDKSPSAYEKYVDRLMASERYGEHRGRYWLDAARYGDTHGIHIDNFREIWSYREWVINALNDNMPFDQFTIEQLAGDLLPNPTLEQRIATGFNRCNITTSEGGAINEEYLVLYMKDRTETTSTVWMGLTAQCASCHDHKYDPLSQKEFYSMSAFFNNTTQPAMDGNRKDTPPIVVVPTKEDRSRWDELPEVKGQANARVERRRATALDDYKGWLAKADQDYLLRDIPTDKLHFAAPFKEEGKPSVEVLVDGYPKNVAVGSKQEGIISDYAFTTGKENVPTLPEVGDFEKDQAFSVGLWVKLSEDRGGAIVSRMDGNEEGYRGWDLWIQDGKPGTHIISKWDDDALKVISRKAIEANKWTHVFLTYDGSSKAEGVKVYINGAAQDLDREKNDLKSTIRSKAPFKIGQRNKGDEIEKAGVQDVRIYTRVLSGEEIKKVYTQPRLAWLVAKPAESRTEEEQKALYDGYLRGYDEEFIKATEGVAALEQEDREIRMRGTIAHVMQEKDEPPKAYVLFRGEYDKRRDEVGPGVPAVMPEMPEDYPKNRLGLAKWLLLPDHPTTARVTVNRFWQQIFGQGIVRTAGDFGIAGELPSHPELLDWMAVEFRESGWDMKKFFKMLVMSSTYRQESVTTPEKLAADRENRLLSRGPRFRMDAEMVRDYALAASGLLSAKIGGPSVRPYQPEGVWEMVAMPNSDTANYKRDDGEKLYRRSMYTFWKRSAPPASMDIFNAPSRETCTVRRERTNTPLQALVTLNDPQFVEAARKLAEHCYKAGDSELERVNVMARRLLARELRPEEREIVLGVLADLRQHYAGAEEDAKALMEVGESEVAAEAPVAELAAYTMVANQMMNLDEVLNK